MESRVRNIIDNDRKLATDAAKRPGRGRVPECLADDLKEAGYVIVPLDRLAEAEARARDAEAATAETEGERDKYRKALEETVTAFGAEEGKLRERLHKRTAERDAARERVREIEGELTGAKMLARAVVEATRESGSIWTPETDADDWNEDANVNITLKVGDMRIAAILARSHDWFTPDGIDHECCQRCGVVRRRDGKNKPCKGRVKVALRAALDVKESGEAK